jgi:hypothetical protein
MIELSEQELQSFYNLTQQRAILENRSYILIETSDGINSMSLEVFLQEYRYVFKPISKAILPYC